MKSMFAFTMMYSLQHSKIFYQKGVFDRFENHFVSKFDCQQTLIYSGQLIFIRIVEATEEMVNFCLNHCVKCVCIRSFSGPYFPAFGLNTARYGVSLRIQYKYGKVRTRKTTNTDTFHAVNIAWTSANWI